jgi:hypothetical protein
MREVAARIYRDWGILFTISPKLLYALGVVLWKMSIHPGPSVVPFDPWILVPLVLVSS